MFIVQNYTLAVILCFVTMICWGSWGNTQKLAAKSWRFELFYWDYVIGIVLFSLMLGFTLGSHGEMGRSFVDDLAQADSSNVLSALIGGVVFNAANILLSASVSIAGLSVAFPLGIGVALVLGVVVNYIGQQKGDPVLLLVGVLLIVAAVVLNGIASSKTHKNQPSNKKGILLSFVAGVLMAFFYRFVAESMDIENFVSPAVGKFTPYSAFFVFAIGILLSNFIFNTFFMRKPVDGKPLSYGDYFKGSLPTHLVGILGGMIWGLGTALSYIASGEAGTAISYGLGQGATMVAALWGVFVWKEFKGASKAVNIYLTLMFIFFVIGLILIIMAGN